LFYRKKNNTMYKYANIYTIDFFSDEDDDDSQDDLDWREDSDMGVEGPDPQLAVLLAIGEGVGGAGPGLEGPGLEGEGPGLEGAGPGLVGLPVLVVSRMMMRTLGMTSLPFNQTVHREFILVGKSCGEV
jgi:hypothetical protein